jgi:hypothetical protein
VLWRLLMVAYWKGEIASVYEYDDVADEYLIDYGGISTVWVEADNPNLVVVEGE